MVEWMGGSYKDGGAAGLSREGLDIGAAEGLLLCG